MTLTLSGEVLMADAPTLDFNAFVAKRKAQRAEGAMEGEHDYASFIYSGRWHGGSFAGRSG